MCEAPGEVASESGALPLWSPFVHPPPPSFQHPALTELSPSARCGPSAGEQETRRHVGPARELASGVEGWAWSPSVTPLEQRLCGLRWALRTQGPGGGWSGELGPDRGRATSSSKSEGAK